MGGINNTSSVQSQMAQAVRSANADPANSRDKQPFVAINGLIDPKYNNGKPILGNLIKQKPQNNTILTDYGSKSGNFGG